jgi:ATP-dependent Lon protease
LDVVQRQLERARSHRVAAAITQKVSESISKSQREFLLRQQLKAIREELGEREADAAGPDDLNALESKLSAAGKMERELRGYQAPNQPKP